MTANRSHGRVGSLIAWALGAVTMACAEGPTGPAGPTGSPGPAGSPVVFLTAAGTASLVIDDPAIGYAQIPGLTASVTVPPGSTYKLLIETDGGVQVNSIDPKSVCFIDVGVFVDGALVGSGRRVVVANNDAVVFSVGSYGLSVQTSLTAGTHTVAAMARQSISAGSCYVSSPAGGSGLPGNPRLQGVLNVIAFP